MNSVQKKYKHAVIATDIIMFAIFEDQLNVLLIKMKKKPFSDCWAAPGGLVKSDEAVDVAAKRNLFDATCLTNIYLEQLYTFGEVNRDPFGRVVSVAYYALLSDPNIELKVSDQYADIKWHSVRMLPELAYDHKEIITYAANRLKAKLGYTNIARGLLPKYFTLTELQRIYEIILNRTIDKRNFRRKILSINIVEKTDLMETGKANRPAALFQFKDKNYKIIEIL